MAEAVNRARKQRSQRSSGGFARYLVACDEAHKQRQKRNTVGGSTACAMNEALTGEPMTLMFPAPMKPVKSPSMPPYFSPITVGTTMATSRAARCTSARGATAFPVPLPPASGRSRLLLSHHLKVEILQRLSPPLDGADAEALLNQQAVQARNRALPRAEGKLGPVPPTAPSPRPAAREESELVHNASPGPFFSDAHDPRESISPGSIVYHLD